MDNLFIVDAFASQVFSGNPAAVFLATGQESDAWMQKLAAEMNLSETAFVSKQGELWNLRWLTPTTEVPLCGHATLATAHLLFEAGLVPAGQAIRFQTRSGILAARAVEGEIELDFPLVRVEMAPPPAGLLDVYGVQAPVLGAAREGRECWILELDSPEAVKRARPATAEFVSRGAPDLLLTSRSPGGNPEIVSRFFGPNVGIPEDPVTGSAHCALADYWFQRQGLTGFSALQASQRGGLLQVRRVGDRVFLKGQAVTVMRGRLASVQAWA